MIPCKPIGKKLATLLIVFIVSIGLNNVFAAGGDIPAGKTLFMSHCAACHQVKKDATGPALMGLEDRHTWADHNDLLKWVHNPAAYMANDKYTKDLHDKFGSMMVGFPDLKLEDIDNIVAYINDAAVEKAPAGGTAEEAPQKSNSNAIIFGVISLILAIIALILMQVNSNLKKMSDDAEGIQRPHPVPFYKNKIYIAILALILFAIAGYQLSKG
ncbi:MAG: cytochrome c, partial [Chitinophagaceae bacterium]|nr:cytochrome c [Chitinophagaceae bacterium]